MKRVFFVLLMVFAYGCSSYYYSSNPYKESYPSTVQPKEYYIKQAWQAIDSFRVADKKEYYGFSLGSQLDNWEGYTYTVDEKTGGRIYRIQDVKEIFDVIGIYTDDNGTILNIVAIKEFDDYNKQIEFFEIIKGELLCTYPTCKIFRGEHDGATVQAITIKSANNDEDWVGKFARYAEAQDSGNTFYFEEGFAWMLHPTLAKIECVVIGNPGDGGVTLTYTGKEYIKMEQLHNNMLKEKIKGL